MASLLRGKKLTLKNPFKNPFKKSQVDGEPKIKLRTKAFNYLKNIYTDYRDVGKDTLKSMNDRPFKALGYGLVTTAGLVFYKKNPTQHDYDSKLVELGNELIMCGTTHSARSEYYLGEINKMMNMGLIEYRSFLFFSLLVVRKFNEFDCSYEKRCAQLNNPNKFNVFNSVNMAIRAVSRIVDVGFCGEWYFLNKNFKDYDVDEKEWINKN